MWGFNNNKTIKEKEQLTTSNNKNNLIEIVKNMSVEYLQDHKKIKKFKESKNKLKSSSLQPS